MQGGRKEIFLAEWVVLGKKKGIKKQENLQVITGNMLYISRLTAVRRRWTCILPSKQWKCLPYCSWLRLYWKRRIKIRQIMWRELLLSRVILLNSCLCLRPQARKTQSHANFSQWHFVVGREPRCFSLTGTSSCRLVKQVVRKTAMQMLRGVGFSTELLQQIIPQPLVKMRVTVLIWFQYKAWLLFDVYSCFFF